MNKAHFTEKNSAEVVTGQNEVATGERLREVMNSITRHLHAAINRAVFKLLQSGLTCVS